MDLDLDGHVALVTGSATGLGHACAEAFARQGANVALASPNLGDLAYASDRLFAMGDGEVLGLDVDVRRPEHVETLIDETVEQYGGIDHLVTGPRPLEVDRLIDVADEDWFRGFDRLFMSVVWAIRSSYSWLQSSEYGTVVTVTNPVVPALSDSVARSFGGAIQSIARQQAQALGPDVRVNAVVPGPHETEDLEGLLTELVDEGVYVDRDEAWSSILNDCPFTAPGDPYDLGKLVAFVSSEHASFVNGAVIPVDGGGRSRS